MKCPKCGYLGFETGDRCKNCGYDFSLLSAAESEPLDVGRDQPADYEIHADPVDDVPIHVVNDEVDDGVDETLTISITPETPLQDDTSLLDDRFAQLLIAPEPPVTDLASAPPVVPFVPSASASTAEAALPLFTPDESEDDRPLIKLPAAPRPPLAVRRTPDTPRLRAVPPRPPARRSFSEGGSPAPVLQFAEEVERSTPPEEAPAPAPVAERVPTGIITGQPSRPGSRIVAVLIDYVILFGIDAAVVYFTVRMAGLATSEWRLLPVTPMLTFLGLLKIAYFYAFTAVGGQTIGKMAVGTCVVSENGRPVDAARAMRRTSAGVLSFLLLGLGFVPALFGDHRALHDRLAGTRVVRLRSV